MKLSRTNALAAFWSIAEATVFFIVPDVLLSWIALRDFKKALWACVWALAGALLGGALIWFIAHRGSWPKPPKICTSERGLSML